MDAAKEKLQLVEKQIRLVRVSSVEEAIVLLKRALARGEAVPKEVVARLAQETELDLGHGDMPVRRGVKTVAGILARMSCLTTLRLANNELDAVDVETLAQTFASVPSLTTIDLSYNELRNEGAQKLAEHLPMLPALSELSLKCTGIRETGTTALSRALQKLVFAEAFAKLELTGNRVGSAGATALSMAVSELCGLRALGLGGGFVGPDGAAALALALESAPSLTWLNLQGNRCCADAARRIVEASSQQLAGLDLGGNKLLEVAPDELLRSKRVRRSSAKITGANLEDDMVGLASALALKSNLSELSLANNGIDDAFVAAVVQFLPTMPSLSSLNFSINRITNFDARLCDLPSLTCLDISYNGVTAIPEHFGDALIAGQLTKLDLRGNQLHRLPRSIVRLRPDIDLGLHSNPLEDPPSAVAVKGFRAICRYFDLKKQFEEQGDSESAPAVATRGNLPPPTRVYKAASIDNSEFTLHQLP